VGTGNVEAIGMGVRRTFNQLRGIKDNIDGERRRFVERVNQAIFREVDTIRARQFNYDQLFELLCLEVGRNSDDLWRTAYRWEDDFSTGEEST
jgi:hypothetical protein